MVVGVKFKLNSSLYKKDPQETVLGKKILSRGITLINEIGFEAFTFKKLAKEISSAEKSIYRYFDSKHILLLFLTSWYWEWVHYLIMINIKNIVDPQKKLNIAIDNIVLATSENLQNEYINENILHRVIINEGSKAYHTSQVDNENKIGMFHAYKSLISAVADIIKEVNSDFPYPSSLSSNLFDMANNQIYFSEHLPAITDVTYSKHREKELIKMLKFMVSKMLQK